MRALLQGVRVTKLHTTLCFEVIDYNLYLRLSQHLTKAATETRLTSSEEKIEWNMHKPSSPFVVKTRIQFCVRGSQFISNLVTYTVIKGHIFFVTHACFSIILLHTCATCLCHTSSCLSIHTVLLLLLCQLHVT